LRLGQRPLQVAGRDHGREIEDRSCCGGDRDPAKLADVAAVERGEAVHPDSTLRSAMAARKGDIDIATGVRKQSPQTTCAPVTDDRTGAASEYGPELPGPCDRLRVTDEVDAAIKGV
jgi:hypothetical protein